MGRQKGTPFLSRKFLLRTALPEHFYGFRLGQCDGYGIFSDLQGGSGRHLGGSIHDRKNGVTYFIHVCQDGLGKRVHVPHDLASPEYQFYITLLNRCLDSHPSLKSLVLPPSLYDLLDTFSSLVDEYIKMQHATKEDGEQLITSIKSIGAQIADEGKHHPVADYRTDAITRCRNMILDIYKKMREIHGGKHRKRRTRHKRTHRKRTHRR